MTKPTWFKSIAVVNRSKVLQTFAKARDAKKPLPRYRGPRLVDLESWKFPRVGFKIMYIDRMEVMYTTRDIMKIFDIDKATVYKWQKAGIFPPPIFTKKNKYNKETRYFIRPQLAVVEKTVNDLRRQGVIRFTKSKVVHHVAMVAEGNRIAVEAWHQRRERDVARKSRGKNGVTWL